MSESTADEFDVWDLAPVDADAFQKVREKLDAEAMGSKRKFWFRLSDDQQPWLFKYTRPNTGEAWAERIAAELGNLIGVPSARVELATWQGVPGVASRSIVPHEVDRIRGSLRPLGSLIHGNEVLAGWMTQYDKEKMFRHADHTWANIKAAIDARFGNDAAAQMQRLGDLIVLDALIGNVDRHHENWALLQVMKPEGEPEVGVSPSYDHASSLGRELLDERRSELLRDDRIGSYVTRGHGGIFWDVDSRRAPSPLELLRRVADQSPNVVASALSRLRQITDEQIMGPVERVPPSWMTGVQKDFCHAFLQYTMRQLRSLDL